MPEWLSLGRVASQPGLAERPVAWRGGELIARQQFLGDVACWHAAFSQHSGIHFALYFEDAYDFAVALYAAWHAGKVVYLPGDTQPATLAQLLPRVDGCAGSLPGALQPATAPTPSQLAPLDPRLTRLVIYTSGSSGEPTAIDKRLDQLDAEVHNLQAAFEERFAAAGSTVYSTVSHQHIYGLLFVVLWPLAAGRPFDTIRLAYPEQMAARLAERTSVLVSSPAHLKRLPDTLAWGGARARLQSIFSSGGPLPPEAADEAFALLGHSPTEVYGSSETGGIAWRQRALHGDRWRALPGVQWRLDDHTLWVRSGHLPECEWFETADRARPLEDGGFVLTGRADRIVKIEEKRVSLTAIETALCAIPEIAEARALLLEPSAGSKLAVVAVPTAPGWEALQAAGKHAFNERLRSHLLTVVERIALPRRFRYVRALPMNSQGKSTEALLNALFRPAMPQPQWLHRNPGDALLELDVTPDLAVFDGHFPGAPVLPGVAQLDWAIEFARGCFPVSGRFRRAEALKFQRPVIPAARLQLSLRWKPEAGQLTFEFRSHVGVHSSGRVLFGAD